MTDKRLKARAKRLADYLESISGETPLEEFVEFSQHDLALEGVSRRGVKQATDAAVRAVRGVALTAEDLYHTEAIVHRTKRPSHKIEDGKFAPFPDDFRHLSSDRSIKKKIRATFSSIGRIDLPERTTYGGTGFVVGENLVMTNRHVAELFTRGVGKINVSIRLKETELDFNEQPSDEADGFTLTSCVMVHPYWDMALFTADLPDVNPLSLAVTPYAKLLDDQQEIVVIGYPARDRRNGIDVQREIFGEDFEVKRIAPGRISRRKRSIRSEWLSRSVEAMAHDASTLGGNSGSAVINVQTGKVVGLHFAGRYLVENYSVPSHELARDPRIVDAGVNFDEYEGMPSANSALDPYWRDADPNFQPPSPKPFPYVDTRSRWSSQEGSSCGGNTIGISNGGEVKMEIPLQITVSLGNPTASSGRSTKVCQSDSAVDAGMENVGAGYDEEFLSESVPTPELSGEVAEDAFELDGSHLIPYTHFSVCQSMSRTLPRFVAWNIDGDRLISIPRSNNFRRDPRVPDEYQADNALYRRNPYDRGHVARRVDLNWGPRSEAERANSDSFFYTNITPQHQSFNQSSRHGLWGELENAILDDVRVEDLKISVMAGPIFREDDPKHRGVKIPRDFWKLLAFRDTADGEFKVAAYILSQKEFVPTEVLELDMFRLYQTSLRKLCEETSLDFDALVEFDTFSSENESVSGEGVREIRGRGDLVSA